MQRKPHRMFVNLASHRDLDSLRRSCGLPAAGQAEELTQDRDQQNEDDQAHQTELGRFRDGEGKPGRDPLGHRPCQDDIVDHRFGGGRRDQLQESGEREAHKRQRERCSMTHEDLVKLAIQLRQRAVLDRAMPGWASGWPFEAARYRLKYSRNRNRLAIRR